MIEYNYILQWGIYWFTIINDYSAGYCLIIIAFTEVAVCMWVYGWYQFYLSAIFLEKFYRKIFSSGFVNFKRDVEMMAGVKASWVWVYWASVWVVLAPLFMLVSFRFFFFLFSILFIIYDLRNTGKLVWKQFCAKIVYIRKSGIRQLQMKNFDDRLTLTLISRSYLCQQYYAKKWIFMSSSD